MEYQKKIQNKFAGLKYCYIFAPVNRLIYLLMQWIDVSLEQPPVTGKYLVKTRTTMGNTHKLEAGYTITNGKGHFNVSNQVVTHWLKEGE